MKLIISFFLAFFFIISLHSQSSVLGTWKAIDDKDGQPTSHIEIFEKDGKIHGKITKLFDQPDDIVCELCKGEKHNQPVLGMEILSGLQKNGKQWTGGRVLDPEDGKTYKCKITLKDESTLNLRGYIGIPALGRTQTWHRVAS